MESHGPNKATLSKALSVALQHPAVASDQQNICRMVQVCKAWRTAVQQSTACLTKISFSPELPSDYDDNSATVAEWAAEITLFAHWLFKYAGTIRSIEVYIQEINTDDAAYRNLCIHAEQAMALSLRSAAVLLQCQTMVSERVTVASEIPAVMSQPLRLHSFSCWHMFTSPFIISALPVTTLTELKITTVSSAVQPQEAVGSLSNLKSLHLRCEAGTCLPDSYLSSINKLSQLTSLFYHRLQISRALALLPQQLIELDMHLVGHIGPGQPTTASLVLSELTQLQQLRIAYSRPIAECHLPQQLQALYVNSYYDEGSAIAALSITSLQHLQLLDVDASYDSAEQLMSLKHMRKLEQLQLKYYDKTIAVAAAQAWPQLKRLVDLDLCLHTMSCTAAQLATVVEAIGLVTTLTSLAFVCLEVIYGEDEAAVDQAADNRLHRTCETLKSLKNLRRLHLQGGNWEPSPTYATDLLHLSALTALTSLLLKLGQARLDDAMTTAVLLELTQLQHLSMPLLDAIGPFPTIGRLQGLTSLSLTGLSKYVQDRGLKYLTQLRKLRVLDGFEDCNAELLQKFWGDLRGTA